MQTIKGNCKFDRIADREPERHCWMLFKVGPLSRIKDLQQGLLYLNSVDFFSTLDDEKAVALRKDELEKTYAVLKSGKKGNLVHELVIHTKDKEIVLNPEATVSIDLPRPKNIMIYCFGAIADGPENKIPGEINGEVWFDKKFSQFGDHILIITNPKKFCDRLNSVIETHENLYSSEYFEGGYGQVDYVNMDEHMGPIGMFRKDNIYSWQREYRLCFGANTEALNSKGALELRIGDLSDISEIVPINKFLASPIVLKRRTYQKKCGGFVQVRE